MNILGKKHRNKWESSKKYWKIILAKSDVCIQIMHIGSKNSPMSPWSKIRAFIFFLDVIFFFPVVIV